MSETTEPKYSDYAGHTTGVSIYPHMAGYVQNANGFVVGDFSEGETTVNDYRQAIANAALFVAAADPETGYVATLAKLAAVERERDEANRDADALRDTCAALCERKIGDDELLSWTRDNLEKTERERADWERRAFAAGEELAEVRADRDDWKKLAAIWRDKRLAKYGLKWPQ